MSGPLDDAALAIGSPVEVAVPTAAPRAVVAVRGVAASAAFSAW